MDYTPYFATLRKTSLLRGMTDAELAALMASLAPRVRRYDKGELLLMAGYETKEVGMMRSPPPSRCRTARPLPWRAWARAVCLPTYWRAAAAKAL